MDKQHTGKRKLSKKERKDLKRGQTLRSTQAGNSSSAKEPPNKKRKKKHLSAASPAPYPSPPAIPPSSKTNDKETIVYQDFMLLDDGLDTATKLFELANIPVVGYRCTTKVIKCDKGDEETKKKKNKKKKKKEKEKEKEKNKDKERKQEQDKEKGKNKEGEERRRK